MSFDTNGVPAWINLWVFSFLFSFFSIVDKEVSLMAEIDKVKEEASKYIYIYIYKTPKQMKKKPHRELLE